MPGKTFETVLRENTVMLLLVFNGILLVASWVMSLVAFPHLPGQIPFMITLSGRAWLSGAKSLLFFLLPLIQSGLFLVAYLLSGSIARAKGGGRKAQIIQEAVFLIFIFIQLLFIHIQRSLIYLAHGVEGGFNPMYFYALCAIILVFIPYFRLRLKLVEKS
jgi:hypothetical protein